MERGTEKVVHRSGYRHHVEGEAGEKVWVQSKYVVEVAVAIERRTWVCGPGPLHRAGKKSSPRDSVGRRQVASNYDSM